MLQTYRVTMVAEYLDCVDLDLESSSGWWATTVGKQDHGGSVRKNKCDITAVIEISVALSSLAVAVDTLAAATEISMMPEMSHLALIFSFLGLDGKLDTYLTTQRAVP